MPKRKADSWPESILHDPDVLSLDDEGRFVLCKVCHVYYAVHGGKKPKPIIMNSSFRTRAWEVHKSRTNSHRASKRMHFEARSALMKPSVSEPSRSASGSGSTSMSGSGSTSNGPTSKSAANIPTPPVPTSTIPVPTPTNSQANTTSTDSTMKVKVERTITESVDVNLNVNNEDEDKDTDSDENENDNDNDNDDEEDDDEQKESEDSTTTSPSTSPSQSQSAQVPVLVPPPPPSSSSTPQPQPPSSSSHPQSRPQVAQPPPQPRPPSQLQAPTQQQPRQPLQLQATQAQPRPPMQVSMQTQLRPQLHPSPFPMLLPRLHTASAPNGGATASPVATASTRTIQQPSTVPTRDEQGGMTNGRMNVPVLHPPHGVVGENPTSMGVVNGVDVRSPSRMRNSSSNGRDTGIVHGPIRRHLSHERLGRQHNDAPLLPTKTHGTMTPEQEIDRIRRWRRMDEDVSRALGSMRMPMPSESLAAEPSNNASNASLRPAVMETEDFSGDNERVARKLKSLDEEYDARVLKHALPSAQRDEMYRRYWGTMRDVYNPANAGAVITTSKKKLTHSSNGRTNSKPSTKEAESTTHAESSTTPDESGSSDDLSKPSTTATTTTSADKTLVNALDRLTGILTKHSAASLTPESGMIVESLARLTQAVDELRANQDEAFARLIELQEQKLQMMQTLLDKQPERHAPPDAGNQSE